MGSPNHRGSSAFGSTKLIQNGSSLTEIDFSIIERVGTINGNSHPCHCAVLCICVCSKSNLAFSRLICKGSLPCATGRLMRKSRVINYNVLFCYMNTSKQNSKT